MTQDEIRRLLGGYATNALSANERQILFEAALEDQELFNALQNEDALRELLDDPVSRAQARRALQTHKSAKSRQRFGSRRWMLGVVVPAVAAVILIAVMDRYNAPRLIAPSPETASTKVAPKPEPAPELAAKLEPVAPEVKKESKPQAPPARPRQKPATNLTATSAIAPQQNSPRPAAEPIIPAPVQLDSTRPAMASFRAAGPAPIPEAVQRQFSGELAASAPLYTGPLVRYSLVRSGPAADSVQVEVTAHLAGYLALYRVDAAGNATRIYPMDAPAVRVSPDLAIQVPNAPIKIAGVGERLRLVVIPATLSEVAGQLGTTELNGTVGGVTLGTGVAPLSAPRAPLVVDIPLAPN
jgi:outer membrane biosynthesis protein TonB